ncbi:MAG: hypothetical protein EBS54_07640 [Betaproteobacteria bacterium]|nr:hypothetical protein [Betaproteobacteria bacterium]
MVKRIPLPDGTVLEFPDGTPQAVIDEVKKREAAGAASSEALNRALASSYAGQDVGQMGTLMRGLGGAKVALDRAALGLKGLVTDLSPEDKALLEQGKAFVNQGGTAANVGNIAGDVAIGAVPAMRAQQLVAKGASVLPRALAMITNPVSSAAIGGGATAAALTPENRGEAAALGAAGGALGEVGGRVASGLYSGGKALVEPFYQSGRERILKRSLERFATDPNAVRAAADNPQMLVPGAMPTLAEATLDPGIAQLQRGAAAASPDVASALAESNRQRIGAYKSVLNDLAGDETRRQAADTARETAARNLYGQAYAQNPQANLTPALQAEIGALMKRPSIQAAIGEARQLAAEEGRQITNQGSIQGLHDIKRVLDGKIGEAVRAGNNTQARALEDTQAKLLNVIETLAPDYANARTTYRELSKPINQMDVGQALSDRLFPALSNYSDDLARTRGETYAKALEESKQMVRKATGLNNADLGTVLEPQQLANVQGIARDIARNTAAAELARVPGSPTAQYLAAGNVMRGIGGPVGLPQGFVDSMLGQTVNKVLNLGLAVPEQQLQRMLGQALTDPQTAARLMAANDPKTVIELLRPYFAPAASQLMAAENR